MMGNSLTLENLLAIYNAMGKIEQIDRSSFFENYYKEVEDRIKEANLHKHYITEVEANRKKRTITDR